MTDRPTSNTFWVAILLKSLMNVKVPYVYRIYCFNLMKDNSYLMTTSFVLCFKWTRINQEIAGWLTTNSMLLYSKRTIDYNLEKTSGHWSSLLQACAYRLYWIFQTTKLYSGQTDSYTWVIEQLHYQQYIYKYIYFIFCSNSCIYYYKINCFWHEILP